MLYWTVLKFNMIYLLSSTSRPKNEACIMAITHAMKTLTSLGTYFLSFLLTYNMVSIWCHNKDIISRLEQSLGFRVFKFQKHTKLPSLGKPFFFFYEGYPLSQKQNSHQETILEIFINKNFRTMKQTSSITLRFSFFFLKNPLVLYQEIFNFQWT
jgi:hypothetical protein